MAVGCRIIRDFPRPERRLVELFRDMPVANIADNLERMAAASYDLTPLGKGQLLGTAFTVRVPQGDNLMFHAAMDLAQPGDVIVIDAGGFRDRAIFGELMAAYCKSRGVRGIVCDGAVRDCAALDAMEDFRVYACGVTPNGPYKNGPGEINVPVVVGGRIIRPGDIIVGDDDGLLAIDPAEAEALSEQVRKTQQKEQDIMDGIVTRGVYPRPWVEEKLREIGCEIR